MAFGNGMEEEKLQEKAIAGRYQKVAVGCWFTSTGRGIPKLVKYEDEAGFRHTLDHIQVIRTEQKYYGGILSRKYVCSAVVGERKQDFILLYYPVENTWDMIKSN